MYQPYFLLQFHILPNKYFPKISLNDNNLPINTQMYAITKLKGNKVMYNGSAVIQKVSII
jgi:hypothetical protein